MRDHSGRWQIEHTDDLNVWAAVRRSPDGRHVRVLVAHDPASLRGKLASPGSRRARPGEPARVSPSRGRMDIGTVHMSGTTMGMLSLPAVLARTAFRYYLP